jgi:hypothetical protein
MLDWAATDRYGLCAAVQLRTSLSIVFASSPEQNSDTSLTARSVSRRARTVLRIIRVRSCCFPSSLLMSLRRISRRSDTCKKVVATPVLYVSRSSTNERFSTSDKSRLAKSER